MPSQSSQGKHYLFAVLNWGLGHATRSIPVIKELIAKGNTVTLASDGDALHLLKLEFPELECMNLCSYKIRYGPTLWSIVIGNSFNVIIAIIKEHFFLRKLLKNRDFDYIISDSRFGFFAKKRPSYIISHQLTLLSKSKILGAFINSINRFFLNQYDECWIPDEKDHRLSGKLSLNSKVKNQKFIGIKSRLIPGDYSKKYDLAILLSGPEPSRSILEDKLILLLKDSSLKIVLVRGTIKTSKSDIPSIWEIITLATGSQINKVLLSSKNVISRSGYTSILDYYCLGRSAILIPTPGQSEQEYLAEYLDGKYGFRYVDENMLRCLKF